MHECLLCKRDMKKTKTIFGTGCLKSIYSLLNFKIPKNTKNKELFLIKKVIKENNISNLNEEQKIWFTDRYLTYKILSDLKYGDFEDVKQQLERDMKNIANIRSFSELRTSKKLKLKNAYDMRKREEKFKKLVEKVKKNHENSQYLNLKILLGVAPVNLNINNKTNPIEIGSIESMKYALWQIVVTGGRIVGYDISADLLEHSLKEKPENLLITEGYIIEEIKNDIQFQAKLKEIVEKYEKNAEEFVASGAETDINFNNSDLYFSIHSADMVIKGKKDNNKWNLEIELTDTYDYTDFKEIRDYFDDTDSIPKSMFSSLLYNLAYFSVKFKIIKVYEVCIKFEINDYEVN